MSAPRIVLGLAFAIAGCEARTPAPERPSSAVDDAAPVPSSPDEPRGHEWDPDDPCVMQGRCPSDALPRFSTELSAAGWARLRTLADTGVVAVRMSEGGVQLDETCPLPGRYVEVAAAEASAGRVLSSDRLVFVPRELSACETATHAVAAFVLVEDTGEAIALPLPCRPTQGTRPATACIGAGLDAKARRARGKELYDRTRDAVRGGEVRAVLPDLLELTALVPEAGVYADLARSLTFLTSTEYGGCRWLSEARLAAHALDPSFALDPDEAQRRPLQHDVDDCGTRPSFSTCFGDRFIADEGGNCW